MLPASDADIWFASGSAAYFDDLDSKDLRNAMAAHWAEYRALSVISDPTAKQRFELETQKGALFLDQLRRNMGDDRFFKLMADFFAAHKTQTVTAQSFLDAAGVSFALPADKGGPMYVASDIRERLGSAILVYGTMADARRQPLCRRGTAEAFLPIARTRGSHPQGFRSERRRTAHARRHFRRAAGEQFSLGRVAGQDRLRNPRAACSASPARITLRKRKRWSWPPPILSISDHMVLVLAGNSALQTVLLTKGGWAETQYSIFDSGKEIASGFLEITLLLLLEQIHHAHRHAGIHAGGIADSCQRHGRTLAAEEDRVNSLRSGSVQAGS